MSNLHDARIEAAARALFHDPLASGDYTWEEMVAEDNSRAELWRDDARRVLAAADAIQSKAKLSQNFALPTVEMIAEVISGHPIGSGYYQTTVGTGEAREIARAVLALIRGGGEQ